jgi:hypothetical protein
MKILGILALIVIVIFILIKIFVGTSSIPFYDDIEAKKITFENLPDNFRGNLSKVDIDLVLDLEFQYQQKIGLIDGSVKYGPDNSPPMGAELNKFIIAEAKKKDKNYSNEEVDAILRAEEVYLKQLGVIIEDKK